MLRYCTRNHHSIYYVTRTNRVHRSGLKNENNKHPKPKIRDFIFNDSRVKADIFLVKERNKVYSQIKTTKEFF